MAYKLMAVDIDGTLLNSKGEITPRTVKAIRNGVEKGLIFTIATGRPIQGVEYLNDILGLDLPYITYNGAMAVLGKSRKILWEQKLSPRDARDIINIGQKFDVSMMIWKDNCLYVNRFDEKSEKYRSQSRVKPVIYNDVNEITENGVTKILWYEDQDKLEKYLKELGNYLSGNVTYFTSLPYFLEFVDKRASKAIALEKLGQYFNIKQSEIIAVGDGFNDISMIEYAGLGVAMGNSHETIKQKADFVTLSNDNDGIAYVIEKFVLL